MAMYAFPIMPGMRELVVKLLTSGKQVFLVSGGFRQVIAPVARVERLLELHASFHGFLGEFRDRLPCAKVVGKSMPSVLMTVESTSKQTASAFFRHSAMRVILISLPTGTVGPPNALPPSLLLSLGLRRWITG